MSRLTLSSDVFPSVIHFIRYIIRNVYVSIKCHFFFYLEKVNSYIYTILMLRNAVTRKKQSAQVRGTSCHPCCLIHQKVHIMRSIFNFLRQVYCCLIHFRVYYNNSILINYTYMIFVNNEL